MIETESVKNHDVTRHAEMAALMNAGRSNGRHEILLSGTVVYATVEPSLMCAGTLIEADIDMVVYDARDHQGSLYPSQAEDHLVSHLDGMQW